MINIYSEDLPRAFELPNSILNDCDQSKPLIALRQASTMELDGFTAIIRFNAETDEFCGEIQGLNGGADFCGKNPDDLRREFRVSLDFFLATCEKHVIKPRKKLVLDARDVDAGDKARIKNIHDGKKCPMCRQGILRDSAKNITTVYKGHSFTSQSRGAFCDNCEDGFVEYDELEEARWRQFRDNVDA